MSDYGKAADGELANKYLNGGSVEKTVLKEKPAVFREFVIHYRNQLNRLEEVVNNMENKLNDLHAIPAGEESGAKLNPPPPTSLVEEMQMISHYYGIALNRLEKCLKHLHTIV